MKTDFQPNEVLTAEDLNANFQECAGKVDKVALETTMDEHMGGIPTFTGLDDKTESQVCLIKITTLGGAVKQGGLLIVQNATSVYSQTIIAGTDIYVRIYQGGYWHEWEHRTIPATQVTLPIEISDVTNLQTSLDGKASVVSVQNLERDVNDINRSMHLTTQHVSLANKFEITSDVIEHNNGPYLLIHGENEVANLSNLITLGEDYAQHELFFSNDSAYDTEHNYGRWMVRFHDISEQGLLNAIMVEVVFATYYEI